MILSHTQMDSEQVLILCNLTSTILEQELRSLVGNIGVGFDLHFLGVGNTLFRSTV
jgi:hypothetical protein